MLLGGPRTEWSGLPRANAQEGSSEVDALVETGIELRRAGDDMRALAVFQRAEKLQPRSTRVRVHLAAAYQALGQWEEADRYLALALENPDDPYVQRHQAMLVEARRTIDSHIASLDVIGGPRGAQVWLNGRPLGTLPFSAPRRVSAGIYTLQVRLSGHYPVTRSVALAGGTLVREQVVLSPEFRDAPAPQPIDDGAPESAREVSWLTWTFAGLAAGAGVGAGVALGLRELHVAKYNDDSECLLPDDTPRGEACKSDREAAERAETWMWISAAAAGAFATASVVSFVLSGPSEQEEQPIAVSCGVGFARVECGARF
jgi:hypothetical protein